MASLTKQPGGRKTIQIAHGRRRHSIRLGKVTLDQARRIKVWIERLDRARSSGVPDAEADGWVRSVDANLQKRLAAAGLTARATGQRTLKELVDQFYTTDRKAGTVAAYKQATGDLLEQWGNNRPIASIGVLDAEKWRNTLSARKYAKATISKRVQIARNLFGCAMRWEWTHRNPFADVKAGSQQNAARLYFVDYETACAVMDACPDDTWRLIFTLCRWGGLRCPSELAALRWSGVNWGRNRLNIYSSKTEDQGKPLRIIPIFPEVHPYLMKAFEAAEPGVDRVFPKLTGATNLRKGLQTILNRAGITPWPKLFQNLRSTRETELAEQFPIQVVCAWIGNSPAVARKHYLQVTEEHFKKAVQKAVHPIAKTSANEAKLDMSKSRENPRKHREIREINKNSNGRGWIRTNEGRAIRFTV